MRVSVHLRFPLGGELVFIFLALATSAKVGDFNRSNHYTILALGPASAAATSLEYNSSESDNDSVPLRLATLILLHGLLLLLTRLQLESSSDAKFLTVHM